MLLQEKEPALGAVISGFHLRRIVYREVRMLLLTGLGQIRDKSNISNRIKTAVRDIFRRLQSADRLLKIVSGFSHHIRRKFIAQRGRLIIFQIQIRRIERSIKPSNMSQTSEPSKHFCGLMFNQLQK